MKEYEYYKCDEIKIDKEQPLIVTLTSWKERANTDILYKTLLSLKEQTLKPDKIIVWLSSEEIMKNTLPNEILEGDWYEICWVNKNLKSFKKFLSIQQIPNAIHITMDDDMQYSNHIIEDLYTTYMNSNKKCIISSYCPSCNEFGQPWGDYFGGKTNFKWISTGCCLYSPNVFPQEVFDLYDPIMLNRGLCSDECFLMPFIIYHDIELLTYFSNGLDFFKENIIINESKYNALHVKFFRDIINGYGNLKTNIKNDLIYDIVKSLPIEYQEKYKKCFPRFGEQDDSVPYFL